MPVPGVSMSSAKSPDVVPARCTVGPFSPTRSICTYGATMSPTLQGLLRQGPHRYLSERVDTWVMLCGELLAGAQARGAHHLGRAGAVGAQRLGDRIQPRAHAMATHQVPSAIAVKAPDAVSGGGGDMSRLHIQDGRVLKEAVLRGSALTKQHAHGFALHATDALPAGRKRTCTDTFLPHQNTLWGPKPSASPRPHLFFCCFSTLLISTTSSVDSTPTAPPQKDATIGSTWAS